MRKTLLRTLILCAMLLALLIPAAVSADTEAQTTTKKATATPTISVSGGKKYTADAEIYLTDVPVKGKITASGSIPSLSASISGYDYLRVKFSPKNGAEVVSVVATVKASSGKTSEIDLELYETNDDGVVYRKKISGTVTKIVITAKHVCGYDYKKIPATTTDPTCTEAGTLSRTCIYCENVDTQINTNALGHSFTENTVTDHNCKTPATCTTDAVYYKLCCRCKEVGTETFILKGSATGHDWDEGVVTEEATEETTGVMTFTCKTCAATRTAEIPVKEHVHAYKDVVGDDYLAEAATCKSPAIYHKSCACGDVSEETFTYGSPADHIWNDGEVTKEPTVDSEGVRTFTCLTCQQTRTEAIQKLEPQKPDPDPEPGTDDQGGSKDPSQNGGQAGTNAGAGNTAASGNAAAKTAAAGNGTAETGDDSNMMLWLALLMVSGVGLTGAGIARRCR